MRKQRSHLGRHDVLTGIMLALLLFRAYVPVGFMPASGAPFVVELCPEGAQMPAPARMARSTDIPMDMPMPPRMDIPSDVPMPTRMSTPTELPLPSRKSAPMDLPVPIRVSMPAHHHAHTDTHGQFQTCPFGSAPAAGPVAHFVFIAPPAPIASDPAVAFEPLRLGARLEGAHQPRGPPSLA